MSVRAGTKSLEGSVMEFAGVECELAVEVFAAADADADVGTGGGGMEEEEVGGGGALERSARGPVGTFW